jgi:hypothetical protein
MSKESQTPAERRIFLLEKIDRERIATEWFDFCHEHEDPSPPLEL